MNCQHNSSCIDGINSYRCECPVGFNGLHCENDIDECLSSPCSYGQCWQNSDPKSFIRRVERLSSATADSLLQERRRELPKTENNNNNTLLDVSLEYKLNYEHGMDGYWCECLPGYTGLNCETKINECEHEPCGPNGKCLDLINEFKCDCYPGYTGATCKENINECITISPCTHQSKCIDLKPNYTKSNVRSVDFSLPNRQIDNSTWGYYCDCNELNMQLFKMNQNKHFMYTGMNCSVELNACLTKKHMCLHESMCESILVDAIKQDINCICKPGFIGEYCETLTTIRLDGAYSPKPILVSSNENDRFHLRFEFRIQSAQLYAAKKSGVGVPIFYAEKLADKSVLLSNQSLLLFKLNAFPKFLNVRNKQLNLNEKIAFFESDSTWHSLEITRQSTGNVLKLVYSVPALSLSQTKWIKLRGAELLLPKESEFISIKFGKVYQKSEEFSSAMCLRDVILNEKYVFLSSKPDTDVKYGCDIVKNECEANDTMNYCQHGSKCNFKWFSNDCTDCEYPFYGKQCHLGLQNLISRFSFVKN